MTMHRAAQAIFAQLGVTIDRNLLFSALADEDGVTQSEIGKRMSSDADTMSGMLSLLEKKELIRCEKCEFDGRVRRVQIASGLPNNFCRKSSVRVLAESMRSSTTALLRASATQCFPSRLDRLASAILQSNEASQKVG